MRSKPTRKAVAVLGALALVASAARTGASAGAVPEGVGEAARAAAKWEGRWAMDLRLATVAHVPLLGADRSTMRSLILVDTWRREGGWVQRQRVCDVRIDGGRAPMSVPDAFVRSIPVREVRTRFPGPDGGELYLADLGPQAFGFDPAVTGGELPRGARAPGVVDADRDGKPGVTVVGRFPLFGSVRIYFVQRSHLVLEGREVAPDRIEGELYVRDLAQRTLGASNRLFGRGVEVEPDEENSGFTLVAAPGVEGCAELREAAEGLFGAEGDGG